MKYFLGLFSIVTVTLTAEPCRTSEQSIDGRKQIVLENQFVRLLIEPDSGGKVVAFKHQTANVDLVRAKLGMLIDRFWQVPRRKNPWNGSYDTAFKAKDEQRIALRLSCEGKGEWRFHHLEKTITLTADSPLIRVDYEYKIHENRMTPSIITPWVINGTTVVGEVNRIFLPLSDGIFDQPYNPSGPPFHQRFFYNPARSWQATIGQKSKAGLAMTMDLSRVMAFYMWFGAHNNTMEWMYNSFKVPHGKSLQMSHELIPCHGLESVAGVGGGIVAGLDVPETKIGEATDVTVNVFNASAGELLLKVGCKKLPGRLAEITHTQRLSIPVNQTKAFTFKWQPETPGLYAVHGQVLRNGEVVCDFERPVRIGAAKDNYELPLLVKRTGNPNERFGVQSDTIEAADIPQIKFTEDIVTEHIKWAKPYYRGPLKVLILTDQMQGREITELQQRMHLDVTVPLIIANKRFDVGDLYGKYSPEMAQVDLTEKLKGKYDVILIGGGNMIWTAEHRKSIADHVRQGTGLVWIGASTPEELKDLLPIDTSRKMLRRQRWKRTEAEHPITAALPLDSLPVTDIGLGKAVEGATVLATVVNRFSYPLIAVLDRPEHGRVVQMNYSTSWVGFEGAYSGLTPYDQMEVRQPWRYWEYWYSLIARAVLWAGKFEAPCVPKIDFENIRLPRHRNALNEIRVGLKGTIPPVPGLRVELTVRPMGSERAFFDTKPWTAPGVTFDVGDVLTTFDRNRVDVRVLAQGKTVCWGSRFSSLRLNTDPKHFDVVKDRANPVYTDGDVVLVNTTGSMYAILDGHRMIGELYDGHGRLISQDVRTPPMVITKDRPFKLPVTRSLHPGGMVVVRHEKDGKTVNFLHREYVTLLPASHVSQKWDDYMGIIWGTMGAYQRSWIAREKSRQIQKLGFNVHNASSNWYPIDFVWPARFGFRTLAMSVVRTGHDTKADAKVQEEYRKTGDKNVLVRTPSLSDPAFKKSALERARKAVEGISTVRPLAYNFGDEVSYAPRGLDYDFSPHALGELRTWLKTEYASIDALNKEWESEFNAWDEVIPFTSAEATATGHYARWADLRLFACWSVAQFHRDVIAEMRKADPNARYGLSGTQVPYTYNGMDWAQLADVFDYHNNYMGGGELPHLHADLSPNCRLARWYGYGATGALMRYNVWSTYLHNQAGVSFYDQFSMLNPDLRPSQSALDIEEATRDLRHGIAKLLLNSEWKKDRVAIYYSMPSILGANITGREHHHERYGWLKALVDCGLQPKYITYLQVRNGEVSLDDFDAVILPMAMALSDKETAALKSFVSSGGTLLADSVPGILSGHCRKLSAGSLDQVFGLKHTDAHKSDKPKGLLRVSGNAHSLSVGEWEQGTELATGSITLNGAKALGTMGDIPAFAINSFGNGKACYLNLIMSKYLGLRASGDESEMRERLRQVFEWSGIRPTVTVKSTDGSPVQGLEVQRYQSGDNLYVGLVLNSDESQPAIVTLPESGHVYDMRRRTYLGGGKTFALTLPVKDGLMLACLPYKVDNVQVAAVTAKQGDLARASIQLTATSNPGLHVFRLEVTNPNNKPVEPLSQNILAPGGKAVAEIPFALNDVVGEYQVTVRDVASGVITTARLVLNSRDDELQD